MKAYLAHTQRQHSEKLQEGCHQCHNCVNMASHVQGKGIQMRKKVTTHKKRRHGSVPLSCLSERRRECMTVPTKGMPIHPAPRRGLPPLPPPLPPRLGLRAQFVDNARQKPGSSSLAHSLHSLPSCSLTTSQRRVLFTQFLLTTVDYLVNVARNPRDTQLMLHRHEEPNGQAIRDEPSIRS